MLTARYSTAVVVDESGAYAGVVDIDTINEAIRGHADRRTDPPAQASSTDEAPAARRR